MDIQKSVWYQTTIVNPQKCYLPLHTVGASNHNDFSYGRQNEFLLRYSMEWLHYVYVKGVKAILLEYLASYIAIIPDLTNFLLTALKL